MCKKIIISLFLLLITFVAQAQKHGNEWINFNQPYYGFKIVKDGLYKIDYTALRNSGIDVNQFTSENIQLFGREKELPIYVFDGGDNKLDYSRSA
jgi:hypothetical protein